MGCLFLLLLILAPFLLERQYGSFQFRLLLHQFLHLESLLLPPALLLLLLLLSPLIKGGRVIFLGDDNLPMTAGRLVRGVIVVVAVTWGVQVIRRCCGDADEMVVLLVVAGDAGVVVLVAVIIVVTAAVATGIEAFTSCTSGNSVMVVVAVVVVASAAVGVALMVVSSLFPCCC